MTICIAAIAIDNNEECIVFATDHMITTGVGQFEHSINKHREINKNTVAMLAGNPILFNDLLKNVISSMSYDDIKHEIFKNFKIIRPDKIKNEILDIYGFSHEDLKYFLTQPIPNSFIQDILEEITEYDLGTDIMLIGFRKGIAEISAISHSVCNDLRDMNFYTIGSGGVQAANTLLFLKHDKKDSLLFTIYDVFKAKRNAEVMEGVGRSTELMILRKEKGCELIPPEKIPILDKIYNEELNSGRSNEKLKSLLNGGGK